MKKRSKDHYRENIYKLITHARARVHTQFFIFSISSMMIRRQKKNGIEDGKEKLFAGGDSI